MKSLNNLLSLAYRFFVVAATAGLLISVSNAAVVTLTDNGSTAAVNLDDPSGMYQWTVTGLPTGMENQLNQQWFWYRIDGMVPKPINTLSAAVYAYDGPNKVSATYANADISVTIKYTLTGGGTGQGDIQEDLRLQNLSGTTNDFHFYQYSDFNLLGSGPGDSVSMDNSFVVQWKGDTQIQEAIISPYANRYEANVTGPGGTLDKLNTVAGLNLNNNGEVLDGDVTWAYQWDFMQLGDEVIQKDKLLDVMLVPEPSVLAFISLGLAALVLRRRTQV
jgi:hypothetical protein